jgi:hypothetical protein
VYCRITSRFQTDLLALIMDHLVDADILIGEQAALPIVPGQTQGYSVVLVSTGRFQTELLTLIMDHLVDTDILIGEQAALPIVPGQAQIYSVVLV